MKKSLSIFIVLVLSFCLFASVQAASDRLEQIKERGYIVFCTEPYWAPNEFIDPNKTGDAQYVGSDIELAKVIAERLGVELRIKPLDFSAVLAGTVEGKCDMAISAIAWSEERSMAMRLSRGYYYEAEESEDGYGFLVREGDVEKYNSIEDLAEAIVITQSGSVQEGYYNKFCGNAKNFKLVANMTDAYLAVSEGKADVCITAISSGKLYAEANGGLAVPDFKFDLDEEETGTVIALPLDGTESLMEEINALIGEILESGQYIKWRDEYVEYARSLGLENN